MINANLVEEYKAQVNLVENILGIFGKHIQAESVRFALYLRNTTISIKHCDETEFNNLFITFKIDEIKAKHKGRRHFDSQANEWVLTPCSLPKKRGEYKYWLADCYKLDKTFKADTKKELIKRISEEYGTW